MNDDSTTSFSTTSTSSADHARSAVDIDAQQDSPPEHADAVDPRRLGRLPWSADERSVILGCACGASIVAVLWWGVSGGFAGSLADCVSIPPATPTFAADLNSAEWPELAQLPGVGRVLSQRIIDHRQSAGRFSNVEQLQSVPGIAEKRLKAVREFVRID